MDPQISERLRAMESQLAENTSIVKKIRRAQKNAALFRLGYWALIILVGFGAFYFIQPFLSQLGEAYGLGDNTTYTSLLEQLKGTQSPQ